MRWLLGFFLAGAIAAVLMVSSELERHAAVKKERITIGNLKINLEGDQLVLSCSGGDDEVRISAEYELMVNGETVPLSPMQEKQLAEFYDDTWYMIDEALRIARTGVEIGLRGAGVGFRTLVEALKAVFSGGGEEAIEAAVENQTRGLVAQANRLKARAEQIESRANRLQIQWTELVRAIPELSVIDCHVF
ncbi:MAG: YggN family protein [Calditrichaeota bacterium]|nr:YggN family protein [Calditrichota bacterium]